MRVAPRSGVVRLSASVMTRDSIRTLPECVASLGFCDEIVIVDDESTDGTWEWASAQGGKVRVLRHRLESFPAQRRLQQESARGEWLLILDADERATAQMAEEICVLISSASCADAYLVPQRNVLPDHWPRPVWFTTFQKRLVRRARVSWALNDWVHTPVIHQGRAPRLSHGFLHRSFDSVPHLLKKQLFYGLSGARFQHGRGERGSLGRLLLHTIAAFLKYYVLKGLFRFGAGGFIVASALAICRFNKHAVLWELSHGTPASERERVPGEPRNF